MVWSKSQTGLKVSMSGMGNGYGIEEEGVDWRGRKDTKPDFVDMGKDSRIGARDSGRSLYRDLG